MAGRKHGEAASNIHIGIGGWNFAPDRKSVV